ncbi:O-antigen ligase family protein [Pseudomonas mandelii]|uniref:O-antigen ligase family protein n=1 Tax=Pseudomonas mandelii TaxID=75612 RepID=UPI00224B846B|nr:O-antigen ligase family protein [Pseudomonas mandelii]MCX2897814.1 O-antigen ligase family protein [Pseudomonas mandelii]
MKYYKAAVSVCFFTMLYLTTGSIELFKAGGAQTATYDAIASSTHPLDYIKPLWTGFSLILIIIGLTSSKFKISINRTDKWIATLSAFIIVSALWSVDPGASIKTAFALLLIAALTKLYLQVNNTSKAYKSLLNFFITLELASLILFTLLPSYGAAYGTTDVAQGIFTQKNGLGNFSLLAYTFFIASPVKISNIKKYSGVILSITLILLSQSTTAIIGLLISTTCFILLSSGASLRQLLRYRKVIVYSSAVTIAVPLILSAILPAFPILGKDATFTGRVFIWNFITGKIFENPLIGHGAGQFRSTFVNAGTEFIKNVGFQVGSTHNGLLDLVYSLGIVGLILYFPVLKFLSPQAESKSGLLLGIIFAMSFFITNSLESLLLSFNIWFAFLIVTINLMLPHNSKNFLAPHKHENHTAKKSNFFV